MLAAIESLPPAVAANARPPAAAAPRLTLRDLFDRRLDKLAPAQRAALSSFALRNARIATQQDAPGALLLRLAGGGPGLRQRRPGRGDPPGGARRRPGGILRRGPKPAPPTAQQTAIELPWRLILSPHAEERWRHAKSPATSAATQHTELWHSRLLTAPGENAGTEPPAADARRTLRANWALGGESTTAHAGGVSGAGPTPSCRSRTTGCSACR